MLSLTGNVNRNLKGTQYEDGAAFTVSELYQLEQACRFGYDFWMAEKKKYADRADLESKAHAEMSRKEADAMGRIRRKITLAIEGDEAAIRKAGL